MFKHLIVIEPLGLLYGSAGKFLSPENLVGRSGTSFPPSTATLSGIFAANLSRKEIENLQLAGPFWAWSSNPHNFYVPTPFNCLVKDGEIQHIMEWHCLVKEREIQPIMDDWKWQVKKQTEEWEKPPDDKYDKGTWIAICDWQQLRDRQKISVNKEDIWKFIPHLHPRLQEAQRRIVAPEEEAERGSLFLENGVQLNPDACLVYLSNTPIFDGWYRFGGEGHLVDLQCKNICPIVADLLNQELGRSFALITPAIWGSQRLSYRAPQKDDRGEPSWPDNKICAILTERPTPTRYRLGNSPHPLSGEAKTLSRGRYAMPAGTVYVLEKAIGNWQSWSEDWFPRENVSFKRWGCGLALPL
jgi:CRISPR-associated protein Cmr3